MMFSKNTEVIKSLESSLRMHKKYFIAQTSFILSRRMGHDLITLKGVAFLFIAASIVSLCGCQGGTDQKLWDQIRSLGKEKTELKRTIASLQEENKDILKQNKKLADLGPDVRLEAFPQTQKIKLRSRTGLFDKDKDGIKETLAVYVQPFDAAGDTFKAAGAVEIQLWDLNRPNDKAMLKQWQIDHKQLQQLWVGTLMTNYYRLKFDVGDMLSGDEEELTVKIVFTDYITGRVFHEQAVIED
ncbi:MAG: hypothetical protein KAJ07_09215 [Planctomycetes bacterium]|nr:hypothetical protein [Planctomycetota bacterium]